LATDKSFDNLNGSNNKYQMLTFIIKKFKRKKTKIIK